MQLAHAGDDGLAGLLVGMHAERRIFLGQLRQRDTHLFLVALGLGLNRHRDDRLGELHALKGDDVIQIAQGITRGDILQTDRGGDVARANFLDLLTLVGVHLQDAADALLPALDRVVEGIARLEHARIDPEEGQGTDEGVGRDLERKRREGRIVGGGTLGLGLVLVVQDALESLARRPATACNRCTASSMA